MTDKTDLQGSECNTLTDDQRTHIEQADDRSKRGVTLCGQYADSDSDDYLARSFGTLFKVAHGPGDREGVKMRLDWCDHGHTTHYFVDGWHVGHWPTSQVTPRDYLESIWSAGRAIAWRYSIAKREDTP